MLDSGGRSQEHPCSICRRTGKVACTKCRRGVVECASCSAPEGTPRICATCIGHKRTFCRGCHEGSALAWEWTADELRTQGDGREAVLWLTEGIERERARIRPSIEQFAGTEKERKANEAALRTVELRMQGKLDRLRQDLAK